MTRRRPAPSPIIAPALVLASATLLVAASAPVPGGDIGVVPNGLYICELPGDAGDLSLAAGEHVPAKDFEVVGDSSYRAGTVSGTYLLTGQRLVLTTGPQAGRRFNHVSPNFLRELAPDGTEAAMRCVRSTQTLGMTDEGVPLERPCSAAARGDPSHGLSPAAQVTRPTCGPGAIPPDANRAPAAKPTP